MNWLLLLILFGLIRNESFFKIKGGVDYMYYFLDIGVGNPE